VTLLETRYDYPRAVNMERDMLKGDGNNTRYEVERRRRPQNEQAIPDERRRRGEAAALL
jgi:hypothetical protein